MKKKNLLLIACASVALCLLIVAVYLIYPLTADNGLIIDSTPVRGIKAKNLMSNITASSITGNPTDETFIQNTADFSIKLFQNSIKEKENSLISPLSVMLALSMTANGANGNTKTEMEQLLANGMSIEELNKYLYTYINNLPSFEKSRLKIANSIWFRDNEDFFTPGKSFLQTNADYYGASVYKSPFDNQTLKDINKWVDNKTNGMIEKILDDISADSVMYLINAVMFDAEWKNPYNKYRVFDATFNAYDGSTKTVSMMSSDESRYIESDNVKGFIKDYVDSAYSFVALLPDENIDINDYIASLTGEKFIPLINSAQNTEVSTQMPKFKYDYSVHMNETLEYLGMPTAFDGAKADFSKLGKSTRGNLFISDVVHKTFIAVDELGTKAGAVTSVEISDESAPMNTVILDRPFVYAIIDNSTKLPLFIGTVLDIK